MAFLKIRIYGDPCLREVTQPVTEIDDTIRQLIKDMADTMYEGRGVGLAATQVGENIRLFVCDTDYERDEDGRITQKHTKALINPEITWESEEDEAYTEGCLSIPGIEGEVYRPSSIKIRYLDANGKQQEEVLEELAARCAQHEFDHLNGILFIDRMAPLKRRFLAGKLSNLRKSVEKSLNSEEENGAGESPVAAEQAE